MSPSASSSRLVLLRKLHARVGMSGAAVGLLFGVTGLLMSHRAVLKLPGGAVDTRKVQVELAAEPASAEALGRDLATRFGYPQDSVRVRVQPPRKLRWSGTEVLQPAQWNITLGGTARFARASFLAGNRSVELEQVQTGLLEGLKRLHQASAGQWQWILLADAFAGSLVFLCLSGILLWSRLAGPRLLAAGLGLAGACALAAVAASGW
jgi:hypothetical protein